jgi:hypothetical protein
MGNAAVRVTGAFAIAMLTATAAMQAGAAEATQAAQTPARYSRAVGRICAGALLFDGRHQIGTRPGAIAVSQDIRATGTKRLRRVDAVAKPADTARLAAAWISLERRLVETYASTYLQIWYAIERANSPAQRAALPRVLHALIHRPDRLKDLAADLEQRLRVPDCTGGQPNPQTPTAQTAHK